MSILASGRLSPTTAHALRAQAAAQIGAGRFLEAERALRIVLAQYPGDAQALHLLGVLALQAGNAEAALAVLLPEARRQAANASVQYNAALALLRANRFSEAESLLRRALELDPELGPAWNNLGNILKAFGEIDPATHCFGKAMTLGPEDAVSQSHALVCAHYSETFTHGQLFEMHRRWAALFAAPHYPASAPLPARPDPDRALTVGFVSPSFNGRIVGQFLRGVLPHLAAHDLRLIAYSATTVGDAVTAELRGSFSLWRDIATSDDEQVARAIRADGVDILIDLAGHTPGNRLLVFARRPAAIQATWLDYFDTTGVLAIDYLITDPGTTPRETAQRFSETPLYLPQTRLCWAPPQFAPSVAPAPFRLRGEVTFGSFNRSDKLSPALLALWGEILRRLPASRLLLKCQAFGVGDVRRHFQERFAALGVSSERIELRGPSSHAQLLAEYGEVDVALDTHPYNGGATTCDALWMGVPVIALRGERMIARQSAAMMDCLGLDELVAGTPQQYVERAVALASDPSRLDAIRASLRSTMAASALTDGPRFASELAKALRQVWRERCKQMVCNQGAH